MTFSFNTFDPGPDPRLLSKLDANFTAFGTAADYSYGAGLVAFDDTITDYVTGTVGASLYQCVQAILTLTPTPTQITITPDITGTILTFALATHCTALTLEATTQLLGAGTSVADNAIMGYIGEFIENDTSGVALTSGSWAQVASVVLSPGDWDVCGSYWVQGDGAATVSFVRGGVSGAISSPGVKYLGSGPGPGVALSSSLTVGGAAPMRRVQVPASTTTTVYMVVAANFSGGSPTGGGMLWARRPR